MISGLKQRAPVIHYHGHEPTDPHAARLLHLAFTPDGAVVAQRKGQLLILVEGSFSRAAKVRECLGWVFKHLPNRGASHSVVASLSDGFPVTVAAAEMVYNDAGLVNQICGDGTYEKLMAARRESEALMIAKRLYEKPGLVLVGSSGKGDRTA